MKRILFIALVLLSFTSFAQTETESRYVWYKYLYGHRLDRMWADSVFHLPFTDTAVRPARPGALMMKSYDSSLAVWNGNYWASIGGAAGTVDATIVDGSANAVAGNAVFDALALKANLASPTFTGTPAAPTATPGTNTTQLATTAFVQAAVSAAGGGSVTNFTFTDDAVFDGTVATGTTTPALSLTINAGSIALSKIANINNSTILGNNSGGAGPPLALTTSQVKTLLDLTGTNSGDVTLAGQNYITISSQVITAAAVNLSGTHVTGTLAAARFPALTGDVTTSAGSLATTIANLAVTNAKVNDVGWSKITGTPTTILGYGITDAMQPNVLNTMGTNGRIVFATSSSESDVVSGRLEIQGMSSSQSLIGHNAYFNSNVIHRATGALSFIRLEDAAIYLGIATSQTAGTTASPTYPFAVTTTGGIIGITSGYLNFNSVSGTTGYGIRDSSGVMQFKPSGGAWTTFGSGSGSGTTDLGYTSSAINGIVTSNTGADATLPLATASIAGLLPPGKFAFVDSLQLGLIMDTTYTGPHLEVTTATDGSDSMFIDAVTESGTSTYLGFNSGGTWGLHSTSGFGGGSLTATRVGYGDGSNLLTGEASFTWDATNDRLSIGNSSTSYNIGINATQPTLAFSQSTTLKGLIGIVDATDALIDGSTAGDMAIKWNADKKLIFSDDGDNALRLGFVDAAHPNAGGAILFQSDVTTVELGHSSPMVALQSTDSTNGSRLAWLYDDDEWAGEIGVTNVDSNFVLIVGPPTKYFFLGYHPDDDISAPAIRFLPNGKIYFYHNEDNSPSYTYPGLLNFKDARFTFGDSLESGTATMQVHGNAEMEMKGTNPSIYYYESTLTQPFTDFGPATMAAKQGAVFPGWGGMYLYGFTDTDDFAAFKIAGHLGQSSPTKDALSVEGWKTNGGTGRTAVTNGEIIAGFYAGTTSRFKIRGDGRIVTNTGAENNTYVLKWNAASGYADWAVDATGSGSPGGSNLDIQYNNAGSFGGASGIGYSGGGILYTNFSDAFLSNNGALGMHSNNFMYAQGGSAGFVFADNNTRLQQIQLRSADERIDFYVSDGAGSPATTLAARINVDGMMIQSPNSGVVIREYTGSSSVYAIYPGGVTPGSGNFAITINDDGAAVYVNASDEVSLALGGSAVIRINGAGTRITSVGGSGTGLVTTDNDGDLGVTPAASSTYTPSITLTANATSGSTTVGQYIRVGNTVTVSGSFSFSVTSGSLATEGRITLPVASSLTQDYQLVGTAFSIAGNNIVGKVFGDATNDAAKFAFQDLVTGAHVLYYHFTYQVL